MPDFNNRKIALVTGGTGGIGTAICERLYQDGFIVIANYRSFTKALRWRELAKQWKKDRMRMGIDVHIYQGDVANYTSMAMMINRVKEDIGPIDVLVNNAGITRDSTFVRMNLFQWQEVIETNLTSLFICTKLVIDDMIKSGWGRIINISSVNGQKGQFGQTNYSAAKSGMYGFTKSLAIETAKKGITVNCISPGYTATEMVMAVKEEIRNKIISEIPLNRLAEPAEIASAVSFLASDQSSYITGANIPLNGGQHMY
ncbi:MAG: acetoacetyl-CoA reductase [Bacteroidetes bacterium]|nr:acetoacetyl-CoA reductase [Bacteroidota bacterium]